MTVRSFQESASKVFKRLGWVASTAQLLCRAGVSKLTVGGVCNRGVEAVGGWCREGFTGLPNCTRCGCRVEARPYSDAGQGRRGVHDSLRTYLPGDTDCEEALSGGWGAWLGGFWTDAVCAAASYEAIHVERQDACCRNHVLRLPVLSVHATAVRIG